MNRAVRARALFEVLMSSVNLNNVPAELGWSLARAYFRGSLFTREGLKLLVKASKLCEPEKTSRVLRGESV